MTSARPFDASIPVLTEVLHDDPVAAAAPAEALPAAAVPTPSPVPDAPADGDAMAGLDDAQWAALETRLAERILQQLQGRVDFVLEQRLKDSMEEVLSHALRGLTMEIRSGLHDTLSKIVSRAVSQELTHLQARKK